MGAFMFVLVKILFFMFSKTIILIGGNKTFYEIVTYILNHTVKVFLHIIWEVLAFKFKTFLWKKIKAIFWVINKNKLKMSILSFSVGDPKNMFFCYRVFKIIFHPIDVRFETRHIGIVLLSVSGNHETFIHFSVNTWDA